MKIRKLVSLTALLSFITLIITGFILYIVPHGRVAYWADWHLWGLSKDDWGSVHINIAVLFLISICFHVYYNFKPLISYLKDKSKRLRVITWEFNVSLFILVVFIGGTYLGSPPFSTVIEIGQSIKDSAADKYGEPPYGHAELSSLKTLISRMRLNSAQTIERLKRAGIRIENEKQTIIEIARQNKLTPKQVYLIMKPDTIHGKLEHLSDTPKPGFGKLTLEDICIEYDLDIKSIITRLADKNIEAKRGMTLKEIAYLNKKSPRDIYGVVKEVSLLDSP
ncbi:MAG: DUF4405 domain-containing protein [Desulfatiglans sp.]|jgi:hypothetical protein|nr:DUF4405 domain-containing protein [Desulfatiglans sp.]